MADDSLATDLPQPGDLTQSAMSGGGLDPALYYALSQGGRFPGDTANYIGFAGGPPGGYPSNTGQSLATGESPNFFRLLVAAAMGGAPGAGAALAQYLAHNYGSAGNIPTNPLSGGPNNFFSGPGAPFGPPGGSLGGLADQGNLHSIDASQNDAGAAQIVGGARGGSSGGHRGGGGQAYHFAPVPPVGGKPYQAQFVGWEPIVPGTPGPYAPTQWTPGKAGIVPAPPAAAKPPKGARTPRGPAQPGTGAAGGGGKPGDQPGQPGTGAAGAPGPGGGTGDSTVHGAEHVGQSVADPTFSGYNTQNLDRGPGGDWLGGGADSVANTAGMPLPTLPAPAQGESVSAYAEQLRQMGIPADAIAGLLGNEGFGIQGGTAGGGGVPTMTGGYNWGTGPVVRGPGGYQFANQGGGGSSAPNAADALLGGIFGGGGGGAGLGMSPTAFGGLLAV